MPARDERKHNPKTSFPFNCIWTQSTLSVNHLMGLYDSPLRQGGLTWNHTLKRVRRDPSCYSGQSSTQPTFPRRASLSGPCGYPACALNHWMAEFTRPSNILLNSFDHYYGVFINTELKLISMLLLQLLQLCPILCDPVDGSPPGSTIPGILQARTLEWVAISFSNAWKWKVKVKLLKRVRLFTTPWTAAYQAPLSMGLSRQEYWSGLPLPSPSYIHLNYIFLPGSNLDIKVFQMKSQPV